MRQVLTSLAGALVVGMGALALSQQAAFDVLITGGRVLDGSGNPWIRADVGIRGDRVAAVGRLPAGRAAIVIDAAGRIVAPGFIDVHSHALDSLTNPQLRGAGPLVTQGLTLVVGNPDGGGPTDLARQAATLESRGGIGVNVALVIGHAAVRRAAMGQRQTRAPAADELEQMKALVRHGVADGAFGLSSGLFYEPGRNAETEEVIALAREAGGVYTSHIRDEGSYDAGVVASVDEVIRIADEANVRGIVSHMKALGPDSWGKSRTLIEHIEAARLRGVEVFADQYPYEASSTSLAAAVMPGESAADAREAMAGEDSKRIFLERVRENIRRRGGPGSIVMASGRGATGLAGKNLEEIARDRGVSAEQAAADIVVGGNASIISFNMSDDDVNAIMQQPWTMASSDGSVQLPGPSLPHPRGYGAFTRRLGVYVRERGVLSLESAVRGMTSLPARVFGFEDRGEIRAGAFADVVIFDPAQVIDRATYTHPYELSVGIDWVIVNGQIVLREGELTTARPGRVLRRRAEPASGGGR